MSQLEGPEAASLSRDLGRAHTESKLVFNKGGKRFPSSLHSGFRGVEEGEKEEGRRKGTRKEAEGGWRC